MVLWSLAAARRDRPGLQEWRAIRLASLCTGSLLAQDRVSRAAARDTLMRALP